MKHLPLLIISLLIFCTFSCRSKHESKESDNLAQYRDTLIGNFSGHGIDTLIAEPIGEKDGGWYFKWRDIH